MCLRNLSLHSFIHVPSSNICTSQKATGHGATMHSLLSLVRSVWKKGGSVGELTAILIEVIFLNLIRTIWLLIWNTILWSFVSIVVLCVPVLNRDRPPMSYPSLNLNWVKTPKKCIYVFMCMPSWKKVAPNLRSLMFHFISLGLKWNMSINDKLIWWIKWCPKSL